MASLWADSLGINRAFTACKLSFVALPVRLKKTLEARVRSRPVFSMATMVFSKDGGSAFAEMASTSASCLTMPASIAGS